MSARYSIGIDLGTTNSALAFVDHQSAAAQVQIFPIPQLVAPGELADERQLPSFLYLAGDHDLRQDETALPWAPHSRLVAGKLARDQGAAIASRMISSAKSWLCHPGVDRTAPILPWGADEELSKLSPVNASAQYLRHLQSAWDDKFADRDDALFVEQDIYITVPASFDEAARELTVAAAQAAGLDEVVLLEEPQAAFYAWIEDPNARPDHDKLEAKDAVLVFDVGGGTTDFTVIRVSDDGESFERTAVGDHLLLGGDNIDLTLAVQLEKRLTEKSGKKLGTLQWQSLVHSCRMAKEELLGQDKESVTVSVSGTGSKLIGGAMKEEVKRSLLEHILDEGFFPVVPKDASPQAKRSGLQEFGLPYAADAAITKHLASFLRRNGVESVDAILFNGGAMTPTTLRQRVVELMQSWQDSPVRELTNERPELAVARGAAYYGLVRRGQGSRIKGGTPRSYFVGIAGQKRKGGKREHMAMCLAPKGLDEGSRVQLPHDFELLCNRPVRFTLFSSSTQNLAPGELAAIGDGLADASEDDSDLLELPPIVTVLRSPGKSKVTVRLEVQITELGSLEIWCIEPGDEERRWRLSFDMRAGGAKGRDSDEDLANDIDSATRLVSDVFSGKSGTTPAQLLKKLEATLDLRRDEWNIATARALFDATVEAEECRRKSPELEARWLNMCGFLLRPGQGAALDEWRMQQMWRVFNEGLAHSKHEACRLAWWILWRRIGGGTAKGRQEQIYDRTAQLFLPSKNQKKKWHQHKPSKQEAEEMWRTLANLERINPSSKRKLGDELMRRMESKKGRAEAVHIWALGRIGSRVPLYGPLNAVVPTNHVQRWLEELVTWPWPDPEVAVFPLAQLGRRTGDRNRDIDASLREALSAKLRNMPGGERSARLVEEVIELAAREERVALGDSLPSGLRLVTDRDS